MNEYFEWRMMVEQTQFTIVLLVVAMFLISVPVFYVYQKLRVLRREHWRLLIRTSRYADSYQEWIPYDGEPGYKVLLKWRPTERNLTGGEWRYLKHMDKASWIDRFRSGTEP